MKIPARFKNVGLWLSLVSGAVLVLEAYGVHINPEKYNATMKFVEMVLMAFGLYNNPTTDNKFYGDDK
jgi:uncharacterized membrane protein